MLLLWWLDENLCLEKTERAVLVLGYSYELMIWCELGESSGCPGPFKYPGSGLSVWPHGHRAASSFSASTYHHRFPSALMRRDSVVEPTSDGDR